ncbi:hypothetical protein QBC45DRAFT_17966 [Copromyces sp. CBS 386.78]|nr:hypothetical protein QBC45DRAFT_17966 [Copromyces sp. CBS 386.78]
MAQMVMVAAAPHPVNKLLDSRHTASQPPTKQSRKCSNTVTNTTTSLPPFRTPSSSSHTLGILTPLVTTWARASARSLRSRVSSDISLNYAADANPLRSSCFGSYPLTCPRCPSGPHLYGTFILCPVEPCCHVLCCRPLVPKVRRLQRVEGCTPTLPHFRSTQVTMPCRRCVVSLSLPLFARRSREAAGCGGFGISHSVHSEAFSTGMAVRNLFTALCAPLNPL